MHRCGRGGSSTAAIGDDTARSQNHDARLLPTCSGNGRSDGEDGGGLLERPRAGDGSSGVATVATVATTAAAMAAAAFRSQSWPRSAARVAESQR